MKPYDVCLAVMVAVIWGLAFVASRIALDEFSPALMTALRFAIAAVPCLFVRKPSVSWPLLIAISGTLFLGQFLAQAYGIALGVPVGLTSVIVQSQALFTIAFAAIAFREMPTPIQALGIGIATTGLLMICGTVGFDFSAGAFAVLMISPISFAIGNLLLRQAGDLAFAHPYVPDRSSLHAGAGRDFDQHRLLAVGPAVAGLPRGAGGAVRTLGPVRRRRGVDTCFRRAVRAVAAKRNGHCGLRHRGHAAVETFASPAQNRLSALMSQPLLIAFVVFAAVMFFTPGPNNVMLLSSGLTHGFRRTLPHIAGITVGVAFMVAAVGLGLGTGFIAYPVLQTILKYAGAAYLIYLSAAIAMSGAAPSGQDNRGGPMTVWGAAVFQWINVKGWVMVIGSITAYAAIASFPWNIVIQTAISLIMGALSTVVWAMFGTALRPLLKSPTAVRAFNIVMAALLLVSLYPVFMDA